MPNWNEAVNRVSNGKYYSMPTSSLFPNLISQKCRVVITGASGAGKTELFRLLTNEKVKEGMSYIADEGRKKYSKFDKKLSLVTIPGQASKERKELLEYLFSGDSNVDGLIHICSFGYNEIWPQNEIAFVETLNEKKLNTSQKKKLYKRNLRLTRNDC